MPTLAELLNLPHDAYEKLLLMSEDELGIYLKDITILEPAGVTVVEEIEEGVEEGHEGKPAKTKRTSKSKEKKAKSLLDADFNRLLSELTLPSDDEMEKMTRNL